MVHKKFGLLDNFLNQIPRNQAAYGDEGISYKYSGVTVTAKEWTPTLREIRGKVESATGKRFNFVLVNRYKDGRDYVGEHKDDEKDLEESYPIASVTLGATRDFYFKHGDVRSGKDKTIPKVQLSLQDG